MSEKRFVQLGDTHIKDMVTGEEWYAPCETSLLELLNEQQATINEYKENWDSLVEKASEIAKRNVVLDERIGQLQRENEELRQELKEKQEDEKEYAREIFRLNKLVKEYSEIRQLGGDY